MQSVAKPSPIQLAREQMRVIDALMVREIYTRFGRENIGFLWIIVEPAMFCLGVVALWSAIKHSGHEETAIVPFVITGYMPLLFFRHLCGKLMRCMQANGALLYHRQVKVISLYLARIGVEFLGTTASFAVVMFMFYMAGLAEAPHDLSLMLGGWLMYCWFGASFAMLIGALAERSEVVEKIWSPASYISIPFSGTFYMLYWMPDELRRVLEWSPQVNGVEMLRSGYFGPGIPTYYYPAYTLLCCAILTFVGLYLVSRAREHIEIE
ncbi:ABC transporter permease [Enterovirga sp. CN4-39]|uniref:ABC transporter permease n=1 Tax=Enterovirga sp. CN4-39 TaxID=3400910 RepID=UPI003C01F4DB